MVIAVLCFFVIGFDTHSLTNYDNCIPGRGCMADVFSLWHACEANRNTIANKTLRTGSVFHGYLDYANTHNDERLKVGCLENVE